MGITKGSYEPKTIGKADPIQPLHKKPEEFPNIDGVVALFHRFLRGKSEKRQEHCRTHFLNCSTQRLHYEKVVEYLRKVADDIEENKKAETGVLIAVAGLLGFLKRYG